MSATVESILTLAAEIAEKEEGLRQSHAVIDNGIREFGLERALVSGGFLLERGR